MNTTPLIGLPIARASAENTTSVSVENLEQSGFFSKNIHLIPRLRIRVVKDMEYWEMIEAGNYDWSTDLITPDTFPTEISSCEIREIFFIRFKRIISSFVAQTAIAKLGLKVSPLGDLLMFGMQFPRLPQDSPIVALGSMWKNHGQKLCAYLDTTHQPRCRFLNLWSGLWSARCRFMATK